MQLNEMLVALGVPVGAFFMIIAIVALVSHYRNLGAQRRTELIRLALEKGQPLPAALLEPPGRDGGNDLNKGIKTIFVGLGLGLFFWFFKPERPLWAVGLMVAIFGVGYLVAHAVTRSSGATPPAP
jgi:hypothetical protein